MDVLTAKLSEQPAKGVAPKNPADNSGGWVTWATWDNQPGNPISKLATSWVVPPAPSSADQQLIYLFNGLQNPAGNEILQPVLQWGESGAGGGHFWSIASWHADSNGHAFCTPSVCVNPGDTLIGVITLLATYADGTHNYRCEFSGLPDTTLMALGVPELTAAEQTLEVYGLTASSQYPTCPFTAMSNIAVQINGSAVPLNWNPGTMNSPQFGERTAVVSNANPGGEVDLYY